MNRKTKKSTTHHPTKNYGYSVTNLFHYYASAPLAITHALILIFYSSCSFIPKKEIISSPETSTNEITYCQQNINETYSLQIVGGSLKSKEIFHKLLQKIQRDGTNLGFQDKAVLWSLIQIHLNPVMNSPESHFQIASTINNKVRYYDVTGNKNITTFPLLRGLESWLKENNYDSKILYKWLNYLSEIETLDFYVDEQIASSLKPLKDQIKKDKYLRRFYFRGDDLLSVGEKLPKIKWNNLLSFYTKTRIEDYQILNRLIPYPKNGSQAISCNYDFALYDNLAYGIDKQIIKGQPFGIIDGKNGFMAMLYHLPEAKSLHQTPIFAGTNHHRGATFCLLQSQKSTDGLWILSHRSRDSGQHIHQMIRQGLTAANDELSISNDISRMRYLFLVNPMRLIVETKKAKPGDLEQLLKMDVPIYHADHIGQSWVMKFNHLNSKFIIDSRYKGDLSCKK